MTTVSATVHKTSLSDTLLERGCEKLGRLVGGRPAVFLVLAVSLCSLSYGMRFIRMEDKLEDGYTPLDAPSNLENRIHDELFTEDSASDDTSESYIMVMIIDAKDNGSMIREAYLDATIAAADYFMHNFSITKTESSPQRYTFSELCDGNCGINDIFRQFKDFVLMQRESIQVGNGLIEDVKMDYPFGKIGNSEISFAARFFGVVRWENDGTVRPTNMKSVNGFMLLFTAATDAKTMKTTELIERWHRLLLDHVLEGYTNQLVNIKVVSTTLLSDAINESSQRVTPFFGLGFLLMTSFVVASIFATTLFAGERMNCGKVIVSVGAVSSPIMAITTTFGIMSLLGCRTNSIMLVTPFLVMAIG